MKDKCLIVTLNGNNNFGNKLQNYALKKILCNYFKNVESAKYKESVIYKTKKTLKYIFYTDAKEKKRIKKFKKFNYYLNYTKKGYSIDNIKPNELNEYDNIFYGSDQIWKPYNYGIPHLFGGKGATKKKNIAYAASFGISNIDKKYIKNFQESFSNFQKIGVREDDGKNIVDSIMKSNESKVVLDPTMLLTTKEWEEIMLKPKTPPQKKYILNYFLGKLSQERYNQIEKIAQKYDCDIINILEKNDNSYISSPREFLFYEKNAFLICTDSFHSSVFAFLFDVPFIVFDREEKGMNNMNSRIDTLLSKFELKNRRYNNKMISEKNLFHDYGKAYEILERMRKESIAFIETAIR